MYSSSILSTSISTVFILCFPFNPSSLHCLILFFPLHRLQIILSIMFYRTSLISFIKIICSYAYHMYFRIAINSHLHSSFSSLAISGQTSCRPSRRVGPKPAESAARGSSDRVAASNPRAAMVAKFPWLLEHLEEGKYILKRKTATLEGDGSGDEPDEGDDDVDELLPETVFAALAAAREEAEKDPEASDCFRVVPLGGMWTAKHLGVAFDAYQGKAATQESRTWCAAHTLQSAMRFDCSLYTVHGAFVMASYWASKMAHFFQMWCDLGSPKAQKYTVSDLASWKEPAGFTVLATSLTKPQAIRRVSQLRDLYPS